MAYQTLILSYPEPHVATVTLNRPASANALNEQMALELRDIFTLLARRPKENRAIVLTGAGKHFCAGADLKERKGLTKAAWKKQHTAFRAGRDAMLACPVPIIAAVNGAAFGGGLELALTCDFIYASREAKFALTEVTLGIMPGLGGTQTLPRATGMPRAKELLFTGKAFSPEEALAWGVANKLCDAATLLGDAVATAKIIAGNAPVAVRRVKAAADQGIAMTLPRGLACELAHYRALLETKDRVEGIAAWNEKRKANFTGE